MPEIKVVGDIRSGKYQPILTGNAIVDAALIDHFCQQLAAALHLPAQQVHAEHHWNLTLDAATIYVIDQQIWQTIPLSGHPRNVIIVTSHDLQRGDITTVAQALAKVLPNPFSASNN